MQNYQHICILCCLSDTFFIKTSRVHRYGYFLRIVRIFQSSVCC